MDYFDTICAPATIPGTGAITVIRISGSESLRICDAVLKCSRGCCSDAAGYTIKHADVLDDEGNFIDDVLVSIFRAPHSYTGEDSAEISCHASAFIAARILERLCSAGARSALPGEFTQRAFINGKMDLAQAEAVADVISSNSSASHKVAVNQLRGGYSAELSKVRNDLLEITALLELELDFSEEDVEFADREKLRSLVSGAIGKVSSLAESFHLGNAIKNGVPVVIAGEPNTGKSTLMNALLGEQRAIISPIAGTTRDTIEETMVVDGIMFRFIDTAGLRETAETVERLGIERTRKMMSKADIILGLADGSLPEASIEMAESAICSEVDFSKQKLVILVNKIDLNKNVKPINNFVSYAGNKVDILYISAKTGQGLDTLRSKLSGMVKERFTGFTSRFSSAKSSEVSKASDVSKTSDVSKASDAGGLCCDMEKSLESGSDMASDVSKASDLSKATVVTKAPDDGCLRCDMEKSLESGSDMASDVSKASDAGCLRCDMEKSLESGSDMASDVSKASDAGGLCCDMELDIASGLDEGVQIDEMAEAAGDMDKNFQPSTGEYVLVTNIRHYEALRRTLAPLTRVSDGLASGLPSDLIAQDLRESISHLGEITGEISTDEVLGEIFKKFCIGK